MSASREAVESDRRTELHGPRFIEEGRARDPLYLFACHLAWHQNGDVNAYQELVASLDDRSPDIRKVAQKLLHRPSPWPGHKLEKEFENEW